MSHEITDTDQMFSVREKTWHGLGVVLPDHPTRAEAQALVHPWEPVQETIFRREYAVSDAGEPVATYEETDAAFLNVRSDTGAVLGVVSPTYATVSNNEMWDVAEALQGDDAEVRFETGGSLKGGAKVWILIRLNEPLVVPGDPRGETIPYYSLQNAHDGSGSFRGQATMTRIVCANTAHIADLDARARGTEFTFRHTASVRGRIEQAKTALAGWRAGLADWQMLATELIQERFESRDFGVVGATASDFLERFIPEPAAEIVSERVRANIAAEREKWRGIYLSETCEGIRGTAYGLAQASVEYAEHFRTARTAETRFTRAYLDRNDVVRLAARLAREAVHA